MAAIAYVGATQGAARDLVSLGYVNNLLGLNLGQTVVDTLISTTLSGYVTKAYVDSQDALNATKAFIDAGDSTRLKIAQVGVANGAAGLLLNGRIDASRVSTASTQRFPQAFASPSAYNSTALTATSTEVLVFPVSVADPGFAYKLLVFGQLDGKTSVDGEYPIIRVHQGTVTGQVVAGGFGMGESYAGGLITPFLTPGPYTYTPPSWATFFDIVCLGGGAGGQGGNPFKGQGGGGGVFATSSVAKGSITSITGNVGTGGGGGDSSTSSSSNGLSGGPSTATATGLSSVSGAGGTNSNPFIGGTITGLSPGNKVLNGATYSGGVAQSTTGQVGNSPGGGGSGGAAGATVGGPGAPGAVWITAFPSSPSTAIPTGPISIVPTAINAQTVITGATTLYVTVVRSGSASTSTVSTFHPGLFVFPVPA
jgi:hypothetical protein